MKDLRDGKVLEALYFADIADSNRDDVVTSFISRLNQNGKFV